MWLVPRYFATFFAYIKSVLFGNPMLKVSNLLSVFSFNKLTTILVIKLESNPPDNKHAMGLSLISLFLTALTSVPLIKDL